MARYWVATTACSRSAGGRVSGSGGDASGVRVECPLELRAAVGVARSGRAQPLLDRPQRLLVTVHQFDLEVVHARGDDVAVEHVDCVGDHIGNSQRPFVHSHAAPSRAQRRDRRHRGAAGVDEQQLHDLHRHRLAVARQVELDPPPAARELQLPHNRVALDSAAKDNPGPRQAHVRGVVVGRGERALGQRLTGELRQCEVGVGAEFQFAVSGGTHWLPVYFRRYMLRPSDFSKPQVIPIKKPALIVVTLVLAVVTAACGSSSSSDSSAPASSSAAAACAKGKLATITPGTLTIGTDNPAYDPYFLGPAGHAWNGQYNHDPYNDQGFESATAYAVAQQLGYPKAKVVWTATPFLKSFAPGPKNFDFYLAQVSWSKHRAEAADLSTSYYDVSQAVVALAGKPIDSAKSVADLKQYKLGAQIATTGYDYINNTIQPDSAPRPYNTTNDALAGLKAGQVDGIVVDYPTAYYMANVQLDNGQLVGQFPPPAANGDHFSLVLDKGSALTKCVDSALATLRSNGTLAKIEEQWLSKDAGAPVLK